MIEPTDSFFLSVLADHLNGRSTPPPDGEIDWSSLLTLADHHEVRGIICHQCMAFLPEPYRSQLFQVCSTELYTYHNRVSLFGDLSAALREAGIPFFTVKGIDVSQWYPVPSLRTMGDCDIVVHPEDKERAHEVFLRLGFENKGQQGHEWIYYKNDLAFELHHRLLYNERGNTEASIALCDRVWDYVREENGGWILDWNFHYIFLLLHLHKHLIHMGIGFRQFMDLYAVASSVSLDWSWIDSQLEKMGLLEFSRRCTHLTECWFKGVEMTERDIHCFQQVLQNGVFGYHNESNRKNRKADILLLAKGPHWLTRLHNLLRSIFPTYEKIRYLEYYRALNGRPWLLPFFWVYRWIRAVRFRMFGKVKRVVDETLVSNQELEERRRELSFWDL